MKYSTKYLIALLSTVLAAPSNQIRDTFSPSCPNAQTSCSSLGSALCFFEAPGGVLLQTQFWDYDPATGASDQFTLHGLWPDNCDGSYQLNCDYSPTISAGDIQDIIVNQFGDQSLYDKMSSNWKNYDGDDSELWEHEFNKHATCINTIATKCYDGQGQDNQNVYDFFRITEELYSKYDSYKFLSDAGITPDSDNTYARNDIAAALLAGFGGKKVYFACDKKGALNQVWYFHHVKGSVLSQNFVQIDALSNGNCPEDIYFYPKSQ